VFFVPALPIKPAFQPLGMASGVNEPCFRPVVVDWVGLNPAAALNVTVGTLGYLAYAGLPGLVIAAIIVAVAAPLYTPRAEVSETQATAALMLALSGGSASTRG
jgi:hypothetical protein